MGDERLEADYAQRLELGATGGDDLVLDTDQNPRDKEGQTLIEQTSKDYTWFVTSSTPYPRP